jgi:hypothetical protein
MRDVATILPTDLRSISSVGKDILAMDVNSIQFRAFVGTAVLCKYASATVIDLPPRVLADGSVLTSWITPPGPTDIAFMYNDSTTAGNADDSWDMFTITDTTSAANSTWCPSTNVPAFATAADNAQRRYRLTLNAAPNQAQIKVGAPIRFAREVRYSIYQAADAQWYVGFQRCTANLVPTLPGACGTTELLAGPVLPATTDTTTSGLYFVYWDQDGNRLTNILDASKIARVGVGIRATSESLRQATSTGAPMTFASGDSLRFTVGIRNRI